MKPDYKNRMPEGMIRSFPGGAVGCGAAECEIYGKPLTTAES